MMMKSFRKIVQIEMVSYAPQVAYLEQLFPRLAAWGYQAVLLAYRDKFPYTADADLSSRAAYNREDIQRIVEAARRSGLEVIPLGFQFSHSEDILRVDRFRTLAGGGGALDLTRDESVDVLVRTGNELLEAHPGAQLIHCGGDEINAFGGTPRASRRIREEGISAYYVRFVNRLAKAFAGRGARVAIWSDMLIRYPEAIDELDRSVVIFYWDYWGYGDRTPFVSLGGGLPNMILLDRSALEGDPYKFFLSSWPRPPREMPIGHIRRFARYWDWKEGDRLARSFPYAQWFRDLGFTVVGALMTYPEKGSFLPDFFGKFSHVRHFARRLHEAGAVGAMACLWQPHWPLLETAMPGFAAASRLLDAPDSTDDAIVEGVAADLGAPWTGEVVRRFLGAGRTFEAADTMNVEWDAQRPLAQRFEELRQAGEWEADVALCRDSLQRIEDLLKDWSELPEASYPRWVLDDLAWRARLQIAYDLADRVSASSLRQAGDALRSRAAAFIAEQYRLDHRETLLASRYDPWFQLLEGESKTKRHGA